FFTSRRRHTRSTRDWSSDVCSSDLAARRLGHAPAWALGSVGGISRFPLIEGVTRLRILGEAGEASARAVELCGQRWHAAGRKVQVVMPDTGSDLNDQLMAAAP